MFADDQTADPGILAKNILALADAGSGTGTLAAQNTCWTFLVHLLNDFVEYGNKDRITSVALTIFMENGDMIREPRKVYVYCFDPRNAIDSLEIYNNKCPADRRRSGPCTSIRMFCEQVVTRIKELSETWSKAALVWNPMCMNFDKYPGSRNASDPKGPFDIATQLHRVSMIRFPIPGAGDSAQSILDDILVFLLCCWYAHACGTGAFPSDFVREVVVLAFESPMDLLILLQTFLEQVVYECPEFVPPPRPLSSS
jgi:hypothetical protein